VEVLARDRDRLALLVAAAREGFGRRRRLEPGVDHRRQVREHLDDAPSGDVLDEIAPVRPDVADGGALAPLLGLEAP